MSLVLPGWEHVLRNTPASNDMARRGFSLPKLPDYFARKVTFVDSVQGAADLLQLAQERPLSHVGMDTEFKFARPPVVIDAKHAASDPRSIRPLILSLALAETHSRGTLVYRFVVDLRVEGIAKPLNQLFRLPVPFVAHFGTVELFCLWQLGIVEPDMLWDTFIAERARYLGRYTLPPPPDEDPAVVARQEQQEEEDDEIRYDLVATCRRYGVPFSFAGDKKRLQESFINHPSGAAFTDEQIRYAATDADAVARLYLPQVIATAQQGLLNHLITIEMPFVPVNARVSWNGVRVDADLRRQVRDACSVYLPRISKKLVKMGIANFRSHPQLKDFFARQGLLPLFRKGDGFTFAKDRLKDFRDRHPAITILDEARRVESLSSDKILWDDFVGADGRVHATHRQLGATSGRQSCRWPNLLGLGRVTRPLVVPAPGFGIGEVDLTQIEVGIAAAVYGDPQLVRLFDTGDVYSGMAQICFADELSEEDRQLPTKEFKKRKDLKPYRERMKTCTLGIIYGMSAFGLSLRLGITEWEAEALLARFMAMFPELKSALERVVWIGQASGFSSTVTGLRRYRSLSGALSIWEKNWMRNHPIQGSAADVFKLACIRLDRLYRRHDAKIILPVHDAVVFEAPLAAMKAVADLTRQVLCQTVQEFFPMLQPDAEINMDYTHCWSKDGNAQSLVEWIAVALKTETHENQTNGQ